jgi:hypothetical protein
MRLLDGWRLISFMNTLLSLYLLSVLASISTGSYLLNSLSTTTSTATSTSSSYNSNNETFDNYLLSLLLGINVFFYYFSFLSYLRYNNRFTTSIIILWSAFFKVQRIIISILPIALGLMFLGIIIFGNSNIRFASMRDIFITIYSVMNCDSIWDTFQASDSSENIQAVGKFPLLVRS